MTEIRSPLQFFQRKVLFPCLQAMPTITSIQIWQWLRYTIGPADWTAPWTSPGRKSTNPRYDSSHPSPITTILFPLRRVTGVFAGEVPGCLPLMCVMICLWVPPQQDLCSNSFRRSHSLNTVLYKHNRNQSLAKKQIKWPMYIFSNTLDDPFLVGGEINCTLQERMFLVHLGYCVI